MEVEIFLGDIDNIDSFVLKNRHIKNSLGHSPCSFLKKGFSLLDVYEFARYGKSNDYPINKEGILQFKKRYKFLSIERILFYIDLKYGESESNNDVSINVSIFQRVFIKF